MSMNTAHTSVGTVELGMLHQLAEQANKNPFRGTLIAVDPGETTGISVLHQSCYQTFIVEQAQIESWPLDKFVWAFHTLLYKYSPVDLVVFESYHVYNWRLNEHSFSEVPTLQIIGALKALCCLNAIKTCAQTAQAGKGFFTDDRLKRMGMYFEGQKHARDSLRHACQFLTFGGSKVEEHEKGNVIQQPHT